jgi:hypothetical protein
MKNLTQNVTQHFKSHNLQSLLKKYEIQQATRDLLDQFRKKSNAINELLKAGKGLFGKRSADNILLIAQAERELIGLQQNISKIAETLYARERAVQREKEAQAKHVKEAKDFIARLNSDSMHGITRIDLFNGSLMDPIRKYLEDPLIEESDKEILRSIKAYIKENFIYALEYMYPSNTHLDHIWTRK